MQAVKGCWSRPQTVLGLSIIAEGANEGFQSVTSSKRVLSMIAGSWALKGVSIPRALHSSEREAAIKPRLFVLKSGFKTRHELGLNRRHSVQWLTSTAS